MGRGATELERGLGKSSVTPIQKKRGGGRGRECFSHAKGEGAQKVSTPLKGCRFIKHAHTGRTAQKNVRPSTEICAPGARRTLNFEGRILNFEHCYVNVKFVVQGDITCMH